MQTLLHVSDAGASGLELGDMLEIGGSMYVVSDIGVQENITQLTLLIICPNISVERSPCYLNVPNTHPFQVFGFARS